MSALPTRLICPGCGFVVPADHPYPFRCPNAALGGNVDHVLRREIHWPAIGNASELRALFLNDDPNPFRKFRRLFHAYHVGRSRGLSDDQFLEIVDELDRAVAAVGGHGFRDTPFFRSPEMGAALGLGDTGEIWIKDETGNVSGSHKARHLMGLMIWMEMSRRTGLSGDANESLAIASCGNAALAAAVVAKAAGRALEVFVPPDAAPSVLERLSGLGARLTRCPREPGGVPGDPCYRRFRDAVDAGALPFAVQGNENGLTVEGGATLGYEMIAALVGQDHTLDELFVQVGGGALVSSQAQAFLEAVEAGLLPHPPRIHTVQTEGAAPLARAYRRMEKNIASAGIEDPSKSSIDTLMRNARIHRSEFMWPWETEPKSIATGILDDETYDWAAAVEGMLRTGGTPIVVSESDLREANQLGHRTTGIAVDPTGSAGLAGCLHYLRTSADLSNLSFAVLFTGVER